MKLSIVVLFGALIMLINPGCDLKSSNSLEPDKPKTNVLDTAEKTPSPDSLVIDIETLDTEKETPCPDSLVIDIKALDTALKILGNSPTAQQYKNLGTQCDALAEKYKSNDGCKNEGVEGEFRLSVLKTHCSNFHTKSKQ